MTVEARALGDVDLVRLCRVKEVIAWRKGLDHSRWVFSSSEDGVPVVVKLWNPSYLRRDTLPRAIDAGLYDAVTVAGLRAVLFHRGLCRGYVMTHGARCRRIDAEFVTALWERTAASGFFACQYRRSHTFRIGARRTLIDLEGAYPIAELGRSRHSIVIEDPDYACLVRRLAEERLTPAEVRAMAAGHVAAHRGAFLGTRRTLRGWVAAKAEGMRRRLATGPGRRQPDSRHLIEY